MENDITIMMSELREFTQYEAIEYTRDFICPECGGSGDGFHHVPGEGYISLPEAKLIGWCSTPNGYMMVFECPKCFKKFRYHNTTTGRNRFDSFKEDMWLVWHLQTYKK